MGGGGGKDNKASAWIGWEGVGLTKVSADPLKKLMVKAEVWIQPEKWANERKKHYSSKEKEKRLRHDILLIIFSLKAKKNHSNTFEGK